MNTDPSWSWSSAFPSQPAATARRPATAENEQPDRPTTPRTRDSNQQNSRRYGPRTCRICLDSVEPKFPSRVTTALGISATSSKPIYVSDDPELGRLFSPCKCKGTQKYVHEGCLNQWRRSSPSGTNMWQCPTCKYSYTLGRLRWARMLSNWSSQVVLTLVIFTICIFILGFIADPIFNLWLDPVGTIGETVGSVMGDVDDYGEPLFEYGGGWYQHFIKGFFSLGIVGMLKSMFLMSPWHWFSIRTSGRRRGSGRGRVENISLILVLIGTFAALKAIWKGVGALSSRILTRVSDTVLDVGGDEPDEPEPEPDTSRKET